MPTDEGGYSSGSEPTFADVLNNLSLDSGRARRRGGEVPEAAPEAAAEEAVEPAPEPAEADLPVTDDQPDEAAAALEEPAAQEAAAVRPYTWTGGRTRPIYELEVETLISTTEYGRDVAALTSVEHRSVAELCTNPCSVAEISALLSVPLGVARVVVGDMADIGLVEVHRTASSSGEAPDMALMERVLSGLRRL